MGRRSGARDEPIKVQRRKAQVLKRRRAPKVQRSFSAASLEATVARLTDELKEALERQQATAEVLSAISRSKFELQPILQSVVDTAAQLCRADAAVIFRLEAGIYRFAAGYSLDPVYLEHERQTPISPGPGTLIGRAAMSRQVVQIEDAWTDPLYEQKRAIKRAGRHSMMGVPLMRASEPIGVIGLARNRVDPFTQREIELVKTFADQAVIAIENARLFEAEQQRTRELSESLEQQTATSEVLQAISGSPGKLEPVFATMLEKAVRICDASFGSMALREGDGFRRVCMHNAPPQFVQFHEKEPLFDATVSRSVSQVVAIKEVLHIADLQATDPTSRLAKYAGARTLLNVPLLKEKELVGIMGIYRQEVRPFTDKQIKLVQNFAAQAVIAIENARLLDELRRRTTDLTESLEQQTATSEVLRVIGGSPGDSTPVFNAILTNAVRICGAKLGNLFVREGDFFRIAATHGAPQAYLDYLHRERVFRADPRVGIGVLMRTKRTYHVADLRLEPTYDERLRMATIELAAARSLIGVPMLKEGEVNGCIAIYRQEVRPFTDKQIELVENFAKQAVIAIENTRLLNELRESLQQQTAMAEILQVINRSPGDLAPVFDVMLEKALGLCEAAFGILWTYDGERVNAAALSGVPPQYAEFLRRGPYPVGLDNAHGRLLRGDSVVHIADIVEDDAYRSGDPIRRGLVELGGGRTLLAVPLRKDDAFLGCFVIYRQEVRPFSQKQIALLQNFAAQAVIAIENTRLLNELRQRTTDLTESLEQQTATANVLRVIAGSPTDIEPVLEVIVRTAGELCRSEYAVLFRLRDGKYHMAWSNNADPDWVKYWSEHPITPDRGSLLGRTVLERRSVHIADCLSDPEYTWQEAARLGRQRSMLGVPLLRDGAPIGGICLLRTVVKPFTEKQIELVTAFADQAVIAIENTRLLTELRQRTDELGRSVGELRALGEVSQAVNSTLDLETVLSTIVAKAVQLSGTEAGAIYVYDDLRRQFHLRATYGMDQELIDALTRQQIDVRDPNVAAVVTEGEPIQVADLREEALSDLNEITLRAGYRARLVAPLIRGEAVVGMLVVRRKTPGAFPQNTVELIKTFAAQSALAIENARLFHDVEASLQDLRTAQDRLVQTEKLASLGQLTAGIAHEIKNPLNFVNNFSGVSAELLNELQETLGKVTADDNTRAEIAELADTLRDNLAKVVQHGRRADSIVKNMLLHSRAGSGEHRPVDINAVVEEAVNLAYHGARAEKQGFNINLERSFDPTAGQVDCFPQEITRVLLNLISNGFYAATKRKVQAADDGFEPTLRATTRGLGDRVEIRIRDNGTGIPPEVREKMFNPFFTTKPAGEGTGLGLSISHDIIVKQHAGSMEVDTKADEFTEFRIVLPREGHFP